MWRRRGQAEEQPEQQQEEPTAGGRQPGQEEPSRDAGEADQEGVLFTGPGTMTISGQAIGGRMTVRGPAIPPIPRIPQAPAGSGRQAAVSAWGGQINITDSVIGGTVEASGGGQVNIDGTVVSGPEAADNDGPDADSEAG